MDIFFYSHKNSWCILFYTFFFNRAFTNTGQSFLGRFRKLYLSAHVNADNAIKIDALTIVFYLLLNFTVGISIGIITQIIFSAVQFAGDFFGIQMGFALAEVLNPVYEEEVSLFSELTFLLTTMIFFIFKGHIWLYTLIIESFKKLPVIFSLNQDVFMVLSQKLGDVMIIGVEFALPITAFMLLTNISLGIASRLMPQLNVFMIGLPLNIIIGFLIFTVVIYTWEENFTRLFFQIYTWLQNTITMFAK